MTDICDDIPRLRALIRLFDPFSCGGTAGPICEISGANDPGHDYCRTCARWRVRRLRRQGQYPDVEVEGGGDPAHDVEAPAYCVSCDRLLDYCLRESGLAEELDRWCQRVWTAPVTPADAYRLHEALMAAENYAFDQPGMIARAIEAGERAAVHLPV